VSLKREKRKKGWELLTHADTGTFGHLTKIQTH